VLIMLTSHSAQGTMTVSVFCELWVIKV
jgi:predicted enzyme related to lactoylglutathione lyase